MLPPPPPENLTPGKGNTGTGEQVRRHSEESVSSREYLYPVSDLDFISGRPPLRTSRRVYTAHPLVRVA